MSTATRADADIQEDVLAELDYDPRVEANEVGVRVKDGVVTLYGTVANYMQRLAAQEGAHTVRGVKAVANELQVRLPQAGVRTDEDVARAAAEALRWDVSVPHEQIDVTVAEGRVMLTGRVPWDYQRRAAEQAVRCLTGVKGVANTITVTAHPEAGDIKRKIEAALVRSAETDAGRIRVDVHGSRVILRGAVRSWTERRDAERAAWSAAGVIDVDDQITISP